LVEIVDLEVLKDKNLTKGTYLVKKPLRKYLSADAVREVIKGIPAGRDKFLIIFLWMTGLRVSEVICIRKCDVDLQNGIMRVRWLKNRKFFERIVPIHQNLLVMLEFNIAGLKLEDKLFGISRQMVFFVTKKWAGVNPHVFRHSFAVHYLRSGGRIENLCKLLGHSSIRNTMKYLDIVPTDLSKELNDVRF
jgi:integrase/recombinase XerD